MLYYGDSRRQILPQETCRALLDELERARSHASAGAPSRPDLALAAHSDLVGTAISLGELHQAVADELDPALDEAHPLTDALGAAGTWLGRCVYRSALALGLCEGGRPPLAAPRQDASPDGVRLEAGSINRMLLRAQRELRRALTDLPSGPLDARVAEGYAYYALYPEMYFASLHRAVQQEESRDRYAVLGIRSIGCSLAGFVAGALEEMGAEVSFETLRPRGDPFQRHVEVGPGLRSRLEAALAERAGFVIVDEGPGLSLSSFLSVCALLDGIGVREEDVLVLAAWQGAHGAHAPAGAWERWNRLRVYHTSAGTAFRGWEALLAPVQAAQPGDVPADGQRIHPVVRDLSYGRWRELVYPSRLEWPPVNRSAERVKLLIQQASAEGEAGGSPVFAKFAGLGSHGRERYERAVTLAAAGFSPPVIGYAYGFLMYAFLPGRPLRRDDLCAELMSRMLDYYAFVARTFPLPPAPRFAQLVELILVNARKGLDLDASGFVERWRARERDIDSLPLARLDGSPCPHEWITVEGAGAAHAMKTDSADHFEDHTLVGAQSILWDLAGVWEEWGMTAEQGRQMLRLWAHRTGDGEAGGLIDLYRAAYLAFRLGAVYYAMESAPEDDARRALRAQRDAYAERFRLLVGE